MRCVVGIPRHFGTVTIKDEVTGNGQRKSTCTATTDYAYADGINISTVQTAMIGQSWMLWSVDVDFNDLDECLVA